MQEYYELTWFLQGITVTICQDDELLEHDTVQPGTRFSTHCTASILRLPLMSYPIFASYVNHQARVHKNSVQRLNSHLTDNTVSITDIIQLLSCRETITFYCVNYKKQKTLFFIYMDLQKSGIWGHGMDRSGSGFGQVAEQLWMR